MTFPASPLAPPETSGLWLRLDIFLFRLIGAGQGSAWGLGLAQLVARWSWLPLLAMAGLALWSVPQGAWIALSCLAWMGIVQWTGKRLARRIQSLRPFSLGLCDNHLGHGGRAGFPSSHALAMACLLGSLAPFTHRAGLLTAIGLLTLATSWARVHGGAHFPLDVLAGLAVGVVCGLGFGLALATMLF